MAYWIPLAGRPAQIAHVKIIDPVHLLSRSEVQYVWRFWRPLSGAFISASSIEFVWTGYQLEPTEVERFIQSAHWTATP